MTFILSIPIEVRLAALFVLGCCAGAVINLGIYRLAWRQRPIGPWMRPDAKAPPRQLWDRVPVIGWLGLRREANVHGAGFWIRPMLLELLAGIGFALLYWWEIAGYGLVPPFPEVFVPVGVFDPAKIRLALAAIRHEQFVCHIVLFGFMLVAFWVDIDEMTVPDGVTIPCTLAGLVLVTLWPYALLPDIIPQQPPTPDILTSVWLTSPLDSRPWLAQGLTGRPALAAAIVAFCGWCLALAAGGWDRRLGCFHAIRYYAVRIVRHWITYALLGLAVVGSLAIAKVWSMGGPAWAGLASGLAGIVIGGGMVWLVRIFASVALRQEAMGFGDVTLLAMIGAFLGWQATVIIFFLAPFAGAVIGLVRWIFRGKTLIPYGPFLCLAAAAAVLAWWRIPGLNWGIWWDFFRPYFFLGWWLFAVLIVCMLLLVVLLLPVRWVMSRLRRNSG